MLGVYYNEQPVTRRLSYRNQTLCTCGVRVRKGDSEWVVENADCLIEGNFVFPTVAVCFGAVPFEVHGKWRTRRSRFR